MTLRFRLAVLALFVAHVVLCLDAARKNSVTVDESAHLPAGISYWQKRTFGVYHHNPPFAKMVAAVAAMSSSPVVDYETSWRANETKGLPRDHLQFAADFLDANASRYHAIFWRGRAAIALLSCLCGLVVFLWARALFGPGAGLFALALWALSPNVIAHAGLVTTDMGAISLGFIATYAFWRYLERPSWRRALAAGVLFGLAQLTKFSLLLLIPIWGAAWIAWAARPKGPWRDGGGTRRWRARGGELIAGLVVAVCVINLGYGFEGTGTKLGDFTFVSRMLTVERSPDAKPPATPEGHRWREVIRQRQNRFQGSPLAGLPVPLPFHYVAGFDDQRVEAEGQYGEGYPVYLNGELRKTGWAHYYLVALGLKVPLGTWLLAILAVVAAVLFKVRAPAWSELFVLLPPLAFVGIMSLFSDINLGVRYVLPALPFLIVSIARVGRAFSAGPKAVAIVAGALLAWNVAALRYHPYHLAHFNELAGGPRGGARYLVDSNLDWGQGLLALQRWLAEHRPGETVHLAYFGTVDPSVLTREGRPLTFVLAPPWRIDDVRMNRVGPKGRLAALDPRTLRQRMQRTGQTDVRLGIFDYLGHRVGPRPGLHAISVNFVYGLPFPTFDQDGNQWKIGPHAYSYFRALTPIARPSYSILVYDVSEADAAMVRRKLAAKARAAALGRAGTRGR